MDGPRSSRAPGAFALTALALLPGVAAGGPPEDLVRNGDVEAATNGRPDHWNTTGDSETASFTWEADADGNRALVLRNNDSRDTRVHNWRQWIERGEHPAERLKLTARVRARATPWERPT